MKKLTHTSPFLLMLVPVFILVLLTFLVGSPDAKNEDMASKNIALKGIFIKIAKPFSK